MMALGRRERTDTSQDLGYLSDESDFYGDEATRHDLERRVSDFSAAEWWRDKVPSPTEIAKSNIEAAKATETATLYNPYEGQFCGRQLGETVDEFLERLPPSTTTQSDIIPWIFIANPFRKAPTSLSEHSKYELANEGPPDEESDWPRFVALGGNLLEEFTRIRNEIEKTEKGKAKAKITKAVNVRKEETVKELLDTAVKLHCTSGKWMLFCDPAEVNSVWEVVARATALNELGIAAKVAPREGEEDRRKLRLICVYTKDFADMEDVTRVARKMQNLGLINLKDSPIYYKCDAYTYLQISSGNKYNIKASLYNSADVLKPEKDISKHQKLGGFLNKKKKEEGDYSQRE